MRADIRIDNRKYGFPETCQIYSSEHPIMKHKLTKLRDQTTECTAFRHILNEITFYLGYEATQDLAVEPKKITTPDGEYIGANLSTEVAIVPILRSGLGMVDAMIELLPNATVYHIGMYRNKNSILPVQYYNRLPKECHYDVALILEPTIATAGTINATISILKGWGVPKIKIITAIASKQGLKDLCTKHPDVEIVLAAIDDDVTSAGTIVPGLGDAGDRQFATDTSSKNSTKRPRRNEI